MVACRALLSCLWTACCLWSGVAGPPAQFLRTARGTSQPRFYEYPDIEETGDMPQLMVLMDRNAPHYNTVHAAMREAAAELASEKLAFVELRTEFTSAYKFFKFRVSEGLPMAVTVNWTNGFSVRPFQLFLHSKGSLEELSSQKLQLAARRFLAGELTPWIRSAPAVEDPRTHDPNSGALEIVGSQFQELVMSRDDDVLVMFFAPWCGFSKRMQPHVDDLARQLRHVRSFSVLKIDDTQNDVDHPIMKQLTGYPFLGFFPAGRKSEAKMVKVDGKLLGDAEAWLAEALKLLRQRATHPIPDPPSSEEEAADPTSGLLSDEEERQEEF